MCHILFECLNVKGFFVSDSSSLSLFSLGKTNGVVFESGNLKSYAVPIVSGNLLNYSINNVDVSGNDITDYFVKLIQDTSDFRFTTTAEREIVGYMKEKLCYVSNESCTEKSYELPDGNLIFLKNERVQATEPIFFLL